MTPILLWQETGHFPQTNDCWECFQPPLFYLVIKTLASPFAINTWVGLYQLIQVVNFFLSAGILCFILLVVQSIPLPKNLQIASALFWGMNPELISIGALATNDTVLIFTGFLLTFLFVRYCQKPSISVEIALVILISLLCITKGNALVFALCLFSIFGLSYFKPNAFQIKSIARHAVYGIVMFFFVGHFGNFFDKHQKLGYAFTINQFKQNPPNWLEEDTIYNGRKGVTTITNSFFRMHFLSLVDTPYNLNESKQYPMHRTSFWGQLYGQFSNYTFERYPASWQSLNNDNFNFTRINYFIHLPLFLLFIWAIMVGIGKSFKHPFKPITIHILLLLAFVFFVMRYTYIYRDFSNMKVIFIFPALYSIIYLFQSHLQKIILYKYVLTSFILIVILYQINFAYLIRELIR